MALPAAADAATVVHEAPAAEPHSYADHPVLAAHHRRLHSLRTVVRGGDTLSALAQSWCGKAGKWPHLYAANQGVVGNNPDVITPGEHLKMWCHETISATLDAALNPPVHADPPPADPAQHVAEAPAHVVVSGTLNEAGMSSFEQCVIQHESGGNQYAQNPTSTASGLFGFLNTTWTAVTGLPGPARAYSVAQQDAAFAKEYAEAGTSPWAAYDGC